MGRGVSEVLGEALLLVIVVLLVAVFSSGIGNVIPSFKDRPRADFLLRLNGNNFTILHTAGDPLPIWETKVTVYNGSKLVVFNSTQLEKMINDSNRNGYWDFGEWMNVSTSYGRRVVISIVVDDSVVSRLHT